jgi:F-box protein 18 (helicase)
MELTDEQRRVVARDLKPNDILRVMAFAGTGKTSTLIEYAKARPNLRFLYLAFNKSVQREAERRFPANVISKTSHSLAFRHCGHPYQHKLVAGIKALTVCDVLALNSYEEANFTVHTLLNYLGSIDRKIHREHIPKNGFHFYEKTSMPNIVNSANQLWQRMCDPDDERIGMLHDGYLKLFQLSEPVLAFDVIMIDEGQDLNPCQAYIGLKQPVARIITGDTHQQIYAFRGASDFMQRVKATRTLYLTQSFRFGPKIAKVANILLSFFKHEKHPVAGLRTPRPDGTTSKRTIISRTNAFLFQKAAQLHAGHRIGFVGGIQGYRLQMMEDLFYLRIGETRKIKTSFLRAFPSFPAVQEYAKRAEDMEIMGGCHVVEGYNRQISSLIGRIKGATTDTDKADVILTTAHKAKGLEWDTVELCDDFTALMDKKGRPLSHRSIDIDEINLIYVAVTRARENLYLQRNGNLETFVRWYLKNNAKK